MGSHNFSSTIDFTNLNLSLAKISCCRRLTSSPWTKTKKFFYNSSSLEFEISFCSILCCCFSFYLKWWKSSIAARCRVGVYCTERELQKVERQKSNTYRYLVPKFCSHVCFFPHVFKNPTFLFLWINTFMWNLILDIKPS